MAKHVPFAKAVNTAEEWAFSLLKNALPDHYWLLTNIELLTELSTALDHRSEIFLLTLQLLVTHRELRHAGYRWQGRRFRRECKCELG